MTWLQFFTIYTAIDMGKANRTLLIEIKSLQWCFSSHLLWQEYRTTKTIGNGFVLSIILTQYLQNFDPDDQLYCLLSDKQGLNPSWGLLYKRQDWRQTTPKQILCNSLKAKILLAELSHDTGSLNRHKKALQSTVNAQISAIKNCIQLLEPVIRAIQQHRF